MRQAESWSRARIAWWKGNRWSQLAGILRRQIERGEIAPGKLLASISMLMQTYGVSDGTVKRARGALRDEGLVEPSLGRRLVRD